MMLSRRRRRQVDFLVATALFVLVGLVALILWHSSDARDTTSTTTPPSMVPGRPSPSTVPAALKQIWSLSTDASIGAVVAPEGAVVTTDAHGVTAHALDSAAGLWSYRRSNATLCAVGSSGTDVDSAVGVRGVMTVYAKNGWCSQVTTFDPTTGARIHARTSPNEDPGELVFGGQYAGWLGSDLLELWQSDLYRTVQYGNQPTPTHSDGPHTGCHFSDLAIADAQFATIEHCQDETAVARLTVNYTDPHSVNTKWDPMYFPPRATIETGSSAAVIVGITSDREAILVASPRPAVVVYDSTGTEISRMPVSVPSAEIAASTARLPPSITIADHRYTVVGSHLISVDVHTLHLDWIATDVLGLPAVIGQTVLAPVAAGLLELRVSDGNAGRTITIDRGSYRGRVDDTAVGPIIVEIRGNTVVGYRAT